MAISMNLWVVENGSLVEINKSRVNLESQLEDWIFADPSILNLDALFIGRQVRTQYGGYIDLLGITREGDLVVIELKRDKTPRDVVAQCLDYASWVCDLGFDEISDICLQYTNKNLSNAFSEYFDDPIPETINEHHQIAIVAASLDDSTERIIQYLTEKHSININAVFFNTFQKDGKQILGRSFFKDPEEIEEKSSKGKRAAWTGYLFVNTGITEENAREWTLNRKYNYISAGGGPRWIKAIKKLKPNDKFFAYIKGAGYIGYGIVQEEAVPVNEFLHEGHLFIDDLPDDHIWKHGTVDNMSGEWLVRVKWYKTFPQEQVKWLSNGFANQNVVCKLRDARTFEYLKKEFEVDSFG
jgi:hypothetical protein